VTRQGQILNQIGPTRYMPNTQYCQIELVSVQIKESMVFAPFVHTRYENFPVVVFDTDYDVMVETLILHTLLFIIYYLLLLLE